MEEMIWQEHTYALDKAPGVGFGIAVGGARDNSGFHSGENSIVISDVVPVGPARDKLQVNDIIVRINGKPTYNMAQGQAVRELKSCGSRVELTIKRKVFVRVDRDTPPPGPLRRSRSRDLDSLPRSHHHHRRSRSRGGSPESRYRSRSRDLDAYSSSRRRHRSHSRDLDCRGGRSRSRRRSPSRDRRRSRSRDLSRSPPRRRERSYSRSPSYSRHSRRRSHASFDSRSPSPRRSPSPSRRSRRSVDRSWSGSAGSDRSESLPPPRRSPSPPPATTRVNTMRPSSPLSPDKEGTSIRGDVMVFPVKSPEPQTIVLTKTKMNTSYGLKLGTRIFVQDIQPGSLADKSSVISAGDTVLLINGRNMDNKTVQEAIQTIGLSKDKVTMVVKKQDGGTVTIPANHAQPAAPAAAAAPSSSKAKSNRASRSSSEMSSKRSSKASKKSVAAVAKTAEPEQPVAPKREKNMGGVKVLPASSATTSSRTSHASDPKPAATATDHPEYSLPPDEDEDDVKSVVSSIAPAPNAAVRQIEFAKGKNVGIRLAGGNDVGIFVASVQESSAAAKKGLKMGDQILSVNGVNFRNIIREEAVLTLMGLPAGEFVHIVAQAQPRMYEKILERGTGDSFYIRTHFKYDRDGEHEMSFKQGSTFRISDTLYQGMVGFWLGARIGRNNMEIERGVIPNRSRAEQLKMVQDRKLAQLRERNRGGIGRRIMKSQKASDTLSSSTTSSMFPAYERVVLREAGFKRPVVIFGPLADIARERLAGDHSDLYEIAGNEGIVSGQKSNRKGIIRLNTIKDIIEKDKHAILDITPAAVEKLNYTQLYPIVVFLDAPSKQVVKELRNRLACTDEEKKKKPGKLYDRATKMQRGYNYVFTDTIVLTAGSDDWYRRLYSTIKDQQSMPVWVSEDKLGGAEEVEGEGVNVPGDDDQFSYVSAPASDYSVTTAGSDILNSSVRSVEDVTQQPPATDGKPAAAAAEEAPAPAAAPEAASSSSSSDEEDAGTQFKDDDFDDEFDDDEEEEEPPVIRPQQPPSQPIIKPESPLPEAPPREKKLSRAAAAAAPVLTAAEHVSSSSSSEAEAAPAVAPQPAAPQANQPPIIMPKPLSSYARGRPKIRGQQEIPPGRFDPQSFLKSHIKGLNKANSPRSSSPAATPPARYSPEPPPPLQREPSPAAVEPPQTSNPLPARHNAYSKVQQQPPPPQQAEPIYAQVNKNRPKMGANAPVERASMGRDYGAEIDEFISADPYRSNRPQPPPPAATSNPSQPDHRFVNNRPAPPQQQQQQSNQYNRFAGSSAQPKPHQAKPTYGAQQQQRAPFKSNSNGPVKSKFMQEHYKDYMSQVKSNTGGSGTAPFNPRPYSKPAVTTHHNNPPAPAHHHHHHLHRNNNFGTAKEQMYDSGVDTYDNAKPKKPDAVPSSHHNSQLPPPQASPPSHDDEIDGGDDAQVVATASGEFDSNGGVLSSVETGVSIVIPKGAIPPGVKQPIYFKVCRDNTALPPLDRERGETLLSPLVMCGPHGLQFHHPVELRLPHSEPNDGSNMDVSSNSVSVLIDHF